MARLFWFVAIHVTIRRNLAKASSLRSHLKLVHQQIEQVLQLVAGLDLQLGDAAVAHQAVLLPRLLVRERVDAVRVLEVVNGQDIRSDDSSYDSTVLKL